MGRAWTWITQKLRFTTSADGDQAWAPAAKVAGQGPGLCTEKTIDQLARHPGGALSAGRVHATRATIGPGPATPRWSCSPTTAGTPRSGSAVVVARGDHPARATLLAVSARPSLPLVSEKATSTLDDMAEPAHAEDTGDAAAELGMTGTIAALEHRAREHAGDDEALFHQTMATLLYHKWTSVSYHVTRRQCTTPGEAAAADLLIRLAIDHRKAAYPTG